MSAIFYHDEEQKRLALDAMVREEKRRNKKIQTEIRPFGKFYLAEDYHQKYQLRQHRVLITEFKTIYPDPLDFINSTAAARVNGYVSGYGTPQEITENLEKIGMSKSSSELLLEIATNGSIHGNRMLNPPELQ